MGGKNDMASAAKNDGGAAKTRLSGERTAVLTLAQRELVRHAIGLPNDRRRSFRNRFAAAKFGDEWCALTALVDAHFAVFSPGIAFDHFSFTRAAAEAALEPGEALDLEDFPHD